MTTTEVSNSFLLVGKIKNSSACCKFTAQESTMNLWTWFNKLQEPTKGIEAYHCHTDNHSISAS